MRNNSVDKEYLNDMIRHVFRWKKDEKMGNGGEPAKTKDEPASKSEVGQAVDDEVVPKKDEKAAEPIEGPIAKSNIAEESIDRMKQAGPLHRSSVISAGESVYSLAHDASDHLHRHATLERRSSRQRDPSEKQSGASWLSCDMLIILLFWSMRFFVPWISAWHEYNVFILADPAEWEGNKTKDRFQFHDLVIFGSTSAVALLSSVVSDFSRISKYYMFLTFLLLYSLCPIAGAAADVVVRSKPYDPSMYKWWFTSVVLLRWAMAIPDMIFPVQFACIFAQKEDMSRQAHYHWAAIFVLIESLNAFVVFWVIPPKCPTAEWTQITVWMVIGFLLCVVILSTIVTVLVIHFGVWARILGRRKAPLGNSNSSALVEKVGVPPGLKVKKSYMILLMLIPITFSSFVFKTLESVEPEDWDRHRFLSATSLFLMGKVLGILLLVVIHFATGKILKKLKIPTPKADLCHFPHILLICALITLLVRFTTLSRLEQGGVVFGPIPEVGKTVVEFYNVDLLNRSICIRSEFFHPFTVRPLHRGTVELYELENGQNIPFVVCVDPCTTPVIYTHSSFAYKNDTWTTFLVYLPLESPAEDAVKELRTFRSLVVSQATGTGKIRPIDDPQLIFMNTFVNAPSGNSYKLRWSDEDVPFKEQVGLAHKNHHRVLHREGDLIIAYAFDYSTTEFEAVETMMTLEKYSVYCVLLCMKTPYKPSSEGPPFTANLLTFKLAEVAGPNSAHLPSDEELQNDWAIKVGMCLAGMASSGMYLGYIYLFWLDPPFHKYRTTCLAVFWICNMRAGLVPELKLLDDAVTLLSMFLGVFVQLTCAHVIGALQVYSPELDFRRRP